MKISPTDSCFNKHFMVSMALFLLIIALQTLAFEFLQMPVWLQILVALAPVFPLAWSFKIYLAKFRAMDEYLKARTGEAFLWVLGALCFATFAFGMLSIKFDMPEFNLALILPLVFGGHGLVLEALICKDNKNRIKAR
ncbi:hypothetical protein HG263_09160 [Pseudoalteromonas sp. JBTF-M23]|uniref:Uncharacterized protein n=1 Tax=Pseudoalteromonas caenipelagi TaxID=2726988 RepID=A0A849VDS2_9GAMM|nr:hypothetical protein [Pseudoalteromonas caenipelagi]NOU50703.1 hypothetical protein [Pseudoalteromonas caenipelagi]